MNPDARAWAERLRELNCPGNGKRHNAVARILDENCFASIESLRVADHPSEWPGATARLSSGEIDFLAEMCRKARIQV